MSNNACLGDDGGDGHDGRGDNDGDEWGGEDGDEGGDGDDDEEGDSNGDEGGDGGGDEGGGVLDESGDLVGSWNGVGVGESRYPERTANRVSEGFVVVTVWVVGVMEGLAVVGGMGMLGAA